MGTGMRLSTPYTIQRVAFGFPPPDGNQAGFNGDYTGIAVSGGFAYPIWSDTRNNAQGLEPGTGHDEDISIHRIGLPGH